MEKTLRRVPEFGARSLQEALQSYVLLWQVMCLEQAPNPFAFSVGNADRILEPYRAMDQLSREEDAALFKHFLVFYNIGERSWAISQKILISGSREMMGYGIDPLFGTADAGLGFRTLSTMQLPFEKMCGGCASHFGIDPKFFTAEDFEGKGVQFYERVLKPLFFNAGNDRRAPFYLYVNVTTADTLRKVLANPKKYAPNGVYIMRIHGTFVNFLDLSPAIQEDIIARLDPDSTSC